jgi:hypothetical protein
MVPALAVALSACSMHPLPENFPLNFPRASTYDIVQNVRCEMQVELVRLKKSRHRDHIDKIIAATNVGYDFQFTMTENNDANAGSLGFARSSSRVDTTVSLTGSATRERANIRTLQIIEDLSDVVKADCSPEGRANLAYPISGSLRVGDVVRTYLGLERISNLEKPDDFDDQHSGIGPSAVFSEHLLFKTSLTAGATPTLTLSAVVGRLRLTNASIGGVVKRNDEHSLIIGFAQDPNFSDDEFNRKAKQARAQRIYLSEKGKEVVRGARAETALAQGTSEYARNRLALELARQRNLLDDEQDEARFLGEQLLKALRPPDETVAGK